MQGGLEGREGKDEENWREVFGFLRMGDRILKLA